MTDRRNGAEPIDRFANTKLLVEREGAKIVLPSDPHEMTYDEAITALRRQKANEETSMSVNEVVRAFPLDGAHALQKALARIYGWTSYVPTPGFFGSRPPSMRSLEIGVGETIQVVWGGFVVPGIEGEFTTAVNAVDGRHVFAIQGSVKRKDMPLVKQIADLTRQIVAEESVYRGKAIHLPVDNDGDLDLDENPKFLDLTRVNAAELMFSEELGRQITTNLFTPIERTDACRAAGVPLKRGILLAGRYGTGKTLTAFVAAQKAVANGWTFILVDRVAGLREAIEFAKQYQPAVIFAEDIDRAMGGEERTVEIDDILNTIDGIGTKGAEIITILTTNHLADINRAMLRPGRLDVVLEVTPPDATTVERLMRLYGRDMVPADADLGPAAAELAGQIPAVVREVVERAKLYAIAETEPGRPVEVTGPALLGAARGMKMHLELLAEKAEPETTPHERLGSAMADVVKETVYGNGLMTAVSAIDQRTNALARRILG